MNRGDDAPEIPAPERAVLFLDFDGTLVEIAARPDEVRLEPGVEDVLVRLQRRMDGKAAIVSGRRLDDLERFMPGFDGVLIGSHGAETRIDGVHATAPEGKRTAFVAARDMLRAWVPHYEGVLLEEKPVCLVLHYRQAPDHEEACKAILTALAGIMPGFAVRPSKMAVELMPANVSKKAAVEDCLERWTGRIPIAIGDDRTDEDMFAAAEAGGGFGIKVGDGETGAKVRLGGVGEVHAFLKRWLETGEGAS